jgi:thioredoxin-dependent peroxiredoxin
MFADLGLACFAVSVDPPEVARAFARWTATAVPILSDADGEVARAYGVLDEERGVPARWTYFIDRGGRILDIDREVSPMTHAADVLVRARALGMTNGTAA